MKKLIIFLLLILPFNVSAYSTNAQSVILLDMDNHRILYSKNAHNISSTASISKIMTAILAIESSKYNKRITVGNEILKAHGSGIYIKKGEKITIKDLVYGLMLRSGNDAAIVIAKNVSGSKEQFVKLMNKKASLLKMRDSTFNNPSGLDDSEEGNYSTCYDMAILMSYAMKNKQFKKITSTKVYSLKTNKNVYKWLNKNKLLHSYKYAIGGKTGFTKKARRTLVTAASKNHLNLVAVTFNDSSDFQDHEHLYDIGFQEYTNYKILKKGTINILGEKYYKHYSLYIKKDFFYPITENEVNLINVKFELNQKKQYITNKPVGMVKVLLGDEIIHKQKIYIKIKKKEFHLFK